MSGIHLVTAVNSSRACMGPMLEDGAEKVWVGVQMQGSKTNRSERQTVCAGTRTVAGEVDHAPGREDAGEGRGRGRSGRDGARGKRLEEGAKGKGTWSGGDRSGTRLPTG